MQEFEQWRECVTFKSKWWRCLDLWRTDYFAHCRSTGTVALIFTSIYTSTLSSTDVKTPLLFLLTWILLLCVCVCLQVLFACAEALHAHGYSNEACRLAVELATDLLANPPDLKVEQPQTKVDAVTSPSTLEHILLCPLTCLLYFCCIVLMLLNS